MKQDKKKTELTLSKYDDLVKENALLEKVSYKYLIVTANLK